MFENIECDWPLFFCYLILDYCFQGNKSAATEYTEALEEASLYQQSLQTFLCNNDNNKFRLGPLACSDSELLKFMNLFWTFSRTLWMGISPSQGLYLCRMAQHRKTRICPCLEWDSNP
jgi:hypothetical protein